MALRNKRKKKEERGKLNITATGDEQASKQASTQDICKVSVEKKEPELEDG